MLYNNQNPYTTAIIVPNIEKVKKMTNRIYDSNRITSYNVCYTKLLRESLRELPLMIYRMIGNVRLAALRNQCLNQNNINNDK